MDEGRDRRLWSHTSSLLCLLANIHRDAAKRSSPFHPDEWNPYVKPRELTPEEVASIVEFEKEVMRAQFAKQERG